MSGYPQIQAVDAPTPSANVLFDFNLNGDTARPPGRWVLADSFTISFPELEGDADAVDPMYGNRTLEFVMRIAGTKAQALAQQSAMARAVMSAMPNGRGWLRYQLNGSTRPVWFRTFRPQPGDLSFDNVGADNAQDLWDIPVEITAEPFAYGERVTIAAQTVNNDPTAGTNAMRLVLPAVTGDAPTPLDVVLTPASAPNTRSAVTVMAHASVIARPTINQSIGTSDGATLGTDTSAPAAGAAYVGGTYREVSFATTPGYDARVLLPTISGAAMVRGRYRALLRVASTDSTSVYRVGLAGATINPTMPVTIQPNGTSPTWVDLGTVTTPAQLSLSPNGPNQDTAQNAGVIRAARMSGTGSLRLDHLMFVPVALVDTLDARLVRTTTQNALSTGTLYVDGTFAEATSNSASWGVLEVSGTFVRATPGASNVLTFTFSSAPFANDTLTGTWSVTVSYYPRFLYVGDS